MDTLPETTNASKNIESAKTDTEESTILIRDHGFGTLSYMVERRIDAIMITRLFDLFFWRFRYTIAVEQGFEETDFYRPGIPDVVYYLTIIVI